MDGDLMIDVESASEPVRRGACRAVHRLCVGVLVAAVALSGCSGGDPAAGTGSPSTEGGASSGHRSDDGHELHVVSVDGVPYESGRQWPAVDEVGSFTVTSTGVVYVDAQLQIVWESRRGARAVIGREPWHLVGSREVFLRYRDLIGNPEHDLVAWVETDGGQAGDLVVVQPSTGRELARTPAPDPGRAVTLASLDAERLYFRTMSQGPAFVVTASSVFEWRWPIDEPPRLARERGKDVLDVTAGVWAVHAEDLRFEDDRGHTLAEVPSSYMDRSYFGHNLSPDGRFWFAPAHGFVVTATGERRPLRRALSGGSGGFGWLDADTFAFADGHGLHECEAGTGSCTTTPLPAAAFFYMGPGSGPPPDVAAASTCFQPQESNSMRCGYDLPTS